MSEKRESKSNPVKSRTTIQQKSDREVVITRTFDAPARIVFEAWTKPELLKRWWVPKSMGMTLLSCEVDARTGGSYRFVFSFEDKTMAFYGKYVEVTPFSRLAWTNEESADGSLVTTVTFDEKNGKTLVVVSDVHASKESLEGGLGAAEAMNETFAQLDELLVMLAKT